MNCVRNCEDCLKELCMYKAPLFALLGYDELKAIAMQMTCCTYEKGERLLSQGEESQSFTMILEGEAKVFTLTEDGREKVVALLSQNDYFGELYLFGHRQAEASVEAVSRVKAGVFSRRVFQKLLLEYPSMASKLVEELGSRVIQLETVLKSATHGQADARIAALLLEYSRKYAVFSPEGTDIELPLSREGMANYLGIARETMSRKLKKMEKDGLISAFGNRRMRLLRPDLLSKVAMEKEME